MTFKNGSSNRLGYHAYLNIGLPLVQRLKAGGHQDGVAD